MPRFLTSFTIRTTIAVSGGYLTYSLYQHYSTQRTLTQPRLIDIARLLTTTNHTMTEMRMRDLQQMLMIPDVMSGPNCPILNPPPLENVLDLISRFLPGLQPGRSYSAYSSSTTGRRSGHLYVHVACIDRVQQIAGRTGLSEETVRTILAHPAMFPLLWAGCMPFGGVSIDICPNPQIGSEVFRNSRFILTDGRDPILFSRHTSIPRNPSLGVNASATYFLAQTLYGHALTGSVLHYLCVTPTGEVVVIWTGAGVGAPVIGGHLNNIVALHEGHGIWTAMVRNMRQAFADAELFRGVATALQGSENAPLDIRDVVSSLNTIFLTRRGHQPSWYYLGAFNNRYIGNLVRTPSRWWGGSGMNPKGTPPGNTE